MSSNVEELVEESHVQQPHEQNQEQDPQELVCGFCEDLLTEYSTCVLECNHTFHFRCVLIDVAARHQLDRLSSCPTCNEYIVSHEMQTSIFEKANELDTIRREDPEHSTNTINHLMESSEHFRADMKLLQNKRQTMNSCKKSFTTKLNILHTEFKNKVKDTLLVLKGTHKESLKHMKQSEEYKYVMASSRSFSTTMQRIARKYNICHRMLFRRIFGTRNFFYRRYFTGSIQRMISRKFRIRIY